MRSKKLQSTTCSGKTKAVLYLVTLEVFHPEERKPDKHVIFTVENVQKNL